MYVQLSPAARTKVCISFAPLAKAWMHTHSLESIGLGRQECTVQQYGVATQCKLTHNMNSNLHHSQDSVCALDCWRTFINIYLRQPKTFVPLQLLSSQFRSVFTTNLVTPCIYHSHFLYFVCFCSHFYRLSLSILLSSPMKVLSLHVVWIFYLAMTGGWLGWLACYNPHQAKCCTLCSLCVRPPVSVCQSICILCNVCTVSVCMHIY